MLYFYISVLTIFGIFNNLEYSAKKAFSNVQNPTQYQLNVIENIEIAKLRFAAKHSRDDITKFNNTDNTTKSYILDVDRTEILNAFGRLDYDFGTMALKAQ